MLEQTPIKGVEIKGKYLVVNAGSSSLKFSLYELDAKFISELQKYSKNIKFGEFPIGVVTEDGKVIGNEAPFIDGITLREYSKSNQKKLFQLKYIFKF